jgi:hypothetical protein
MADFCLATKMSPTEYRSLTSAEYKAFVKVINSLAK